MGKFECLKNNVNVMREIALRKPNAHIAFLFHKPYRALYNNRGQNDILKLLLGEWIAVYECYMKCYAFVKRNTLLPLPHPCLPNFQLWYNCAERYTLRSFATGRVEKCENCRIEHFCLKEYIGEVYLERDAEEIKEFWKIIGLSKNATRRIWESSLVNNK